MSRYYLSAEGYIVDSQDRYCSLWALLIPSKDWRQVGAEICAELNAGADRLETHKKYKDKLEKEFYEYDVQGWR